MCKLTVVDSKQIGQEVKRNDFLLSCDLRDLTKSQTSSGSVYKYYCVSEMMDGWMEKWIDRQINRWTDKQMDGWLDRQIDKQTNGWMDGWMDIYRQIDR